MPGQWTARTGRAGLLAAALIGAGLLLAACVSDQEAVDMGLATKCEGTTVFSPVADPKGAYWKGTRTEICKGAKRDAGNRDQIVVIDCVANQTLTATARQQMANQRRHGPDYDLRPAVDAQLMRLKLGLSDFAGVQQGLQASGVPLTVSAGGAEQCKAPATAALSN